MDTLDKLERGRESYRSRAWAAAFRSLSLADQEAPLDVVDLELLARSAYLIGRTDELLTTLERAHHAYLNFGQSAQAARCSFWLGLFLLPSRRNGPRSTGTM